MHQIDIADDTFIRAVPHEVRRVVADPGRWTRWWPDLIVVVSEDRGPKGVRWAVDGAVRGTMEIWLEALPTGVVVHYFLRADPTGVRRSRRHIERVREGRRTRFRAHMWELKDELEAAHPFPSSTPVGS